MTLQERLAKTQGQDNGMDIILGGIPAAAQQEQVQQLPATALRPKRSWSWPRCLASWRSSPMQTPTS